MLVQLKCVGFCSTAQYNYTAPCTDLVEVFFYIHMYCMAHCVSDHLGLTLNSKSGEVIYM